MINNLFILRFIFSAIVIASLKTWTMSQEVDRLNLTFEEVCQDLEVFEIRLEHSFSYLTTNRVDYKKAIEAIKKKAVSGMSKGALAVSLERMMGLFIDGHAGVRNIRSLGFGQNTQLPFNIEANDQGYVAYLKDRTSFVEEGFPYILALDGMGIEDWVRAGAVYRAKGSPQFQRRQGVRMLRHIQFMRGELGLPQKDSILVKLTDASKLNQKDIIISLKEVLGGKAIDKRWPDKPTEILTNNIGYLRIPSFSGRENIPKLIEDWMLKFENTNGLIIDVRGNGGGSREGLLALTPYLMRSDEVPHIANVCAYRLYKGSKEMDFMDAYNYGHLTARYAYRETSPRFDSWDRQAIETFKEDFKPQWTLPENQFSDWHYLLLSKKNDDSTFYYNKPIIVLQNTDDFSATDIFLGALKGWRENIKLMGSSSGGGSARSVSFVLPMSGIEIRCASMASYLPTGRLYDGNGIHPDFPIDPNPEYVLIGGRDNVLESAIMTIPEMAKQGSPAYVKKSIIPPFELPFDQEKALVNYIENNDIKNVLNILTNNKNLINKPMWGWLEGETPLLLAVNLGYKNLVKELITLGADLNSSHAGWPDTDVLTTAIWQDEDEDNALAKWLILKGAKVNNFSNKKIREKTNLIRAIRDTRDVDLVQLMVEHGAYLNVTDDDGLRALDYVKDSSSELYAYLKQKGAIHSDDFLKK